MTPLPVAPSRDDPATFRARSDALLGSLAGFVAEANALESDVTAYASICHDAAIVAQSAFNAGLADAASNAIVASQSASMASAAWTAALAANPDLNPVVRMNPATITQDLTIPSGYNAYSAGPLTIGGNTNVTIENHANWSIL